MCRPSEWTSFRHQLMSHQPSCKLSRGVRPAERAPSGGGGSMPPGPCRDASVTGLAPPSDEVAGGVCIAAGGGNSSNEHACAAGQGW